MTSSDTSYERGFGYWSFEPDLATTRSRLQPLLDRLQEIDALRSSLEREGGDVEKLKNLTRLLSDSFRCNGWSKSVQVVLTDPRAVQDAVAEIAGYRIKLTVRKLENRFPAYYLCRTRADYWAEYTFVVEDLYISPGYPMRDSRFVPIMRHGKEAEHLRMSQFRTGIRDLLRGLGDSDDDGSVDDALYTVGSYVLQAAWHEDQLPGLTAAHHFNLPTLRHAIEFLYLCLSGDLWAIRDVIRTDPLIPSFFEHVCRQPLIHQLLLRLAELDNADMNELRDQALTEFVNLSRAFSEFLHTNICWGVTQQRQPLFKAVFGNFDRLANVSEVLGEDPEFHHARERLELSTETLVERFGSRTAVE